jgi:hypothetical protein
MPYREPEPEPREETPPPAATSTGRPIRAKRLTWKLLQQLPPPPIEFEEQTLALSEPDVEEPASPVPSEPEYRWKAVKTVKNSFGMFREYPELPTHDPDQSISLSDQSNIPAPTPLAGSVSENSRLSPLTAPVAPLSAAIPSFGPFKNSTVFGFMNWMWSRSVMKSIAECAHLIEFLKSDLFKKEDLQDFDLKAETAKFDKYLGGSRVATALGDLSGAKDGWNEVEVKIEVLDGKKRSDSDPLPTFAVPGLHYRNLTQTIKSTLQDRSVHFFHYLPFRHYWQPAAAAAQRIYDEIYSSEAFINAHEKLQRQPREPGCSLERIVAALMFWSDSTHLANFGTASLWPLYLFFGNQSKWVRGKPRAGACHHVAYMPKVFRLFKLYHDYHSPILPAAG